jgi:hypothetical protein
LAKLQEDEQASKIGMVVEKYPCAFSSLINDYASLGSFERHTKGIGLNMLRKMGYIGGGLGIDVQGIIQPLEVEGIPQYVGLGYSERECSEATKVEVSSSRDFISSPTPSWDNKNVEKYWKRKAPYSEGEKDMKSRNYCTHCRMSGH